ncbi:glycosyltransferase like family 2-domain-containing protein [Lasiosphaeria miniovina]|uniref:Glycosyltransferase like family 2-domain-containing protein n=1 Tax=Lasiosphaeria miniovina TaxID=1954250 RepID=A0AA39ZTG5_9PEZI|nr:glycosyltransferase like family 2-domain-containing protein [Lasiosphaeria miniovina]KAK0703285.1 glycosyltransferase like family 2-domain-containing protein [Lasiosphaeria miniovina]
MAKGKPRSDKLVGATNLLGTLFVGMLLHKAVTYLAGNDSWVYWFLVLFTWRYLRLVINLAGFWSYQASPILATHTYTPNKDVTVIVPTIDPGQEFEDCVLSIARNYPAKIIIATVGNVLRTKVLAAIKPMEEAYQNTKFEVLTTYVPNKRAQVANAARVVKTNITVMVDDHVFWGHKMLESLLLPFEEDLNVGLVGTNKRARRMNGLGTWQRIWNTLGALYLERHNFEIRATNTIDGGVFVVSTRTCAILTDILHHDDFLPGFENERFLLGWLGPLSPDDDNYVTRFVVRHNFGIKIQYTPDTLMETTVGVASPPYRKFLGQCRRWSRTTWRSNACSLFTDRSIYISQPYCVYAVFLTSLTNFAAVIDPALVYLLKQSLWFAAYPKLAIGSLVAWILLSKAVKVFAYFRRHPQDIWLFPVQVCWGYFHSLIKLWALLTFWDGAWSGRNLSAVPVDKGRRSQSTSP